MGTDGIDSSISRALRLLEQAGDLASLGEDSPGADGGDDGTGNVPDEPIFDPTVFWSVNGFVLFLVICMVLWCVFGDKEWLNSENRRLQADATYQQSLRDRQAAREARKVVTPEQRQERLLQSFRRHKVIMTVTEDDLTSGDADICDVETGKPNGEAAANTDAPTEEQQDADAADMTFSSIQNTGMLRLPCANRAPVPNCCAVCLGSYDVGETVVWSSNEKCSHAFHQECILEWLIKMQPETPCPCCRQEFTDLEALRKEKKIVWAGGNTFSVSAVTL